MVSISKYGSDDYLISMLAAGRSLENLRNNVGILDVSITGNWLLSG